MLIRTRTSIRGGGVMREGMRVGGRCGRIRVDRYWGADDRERVVDR